MTYQRKPKSKRVCKFRLCGEEYWSQYPNSEYCCSNHRQREKWYRNNLDNDVEKIQCLECNGQYVKIGSHVVQVHGYETAREYRIAHGLDYKRGQVPDWHREILKDNVYENGTVFNLFTKNATANRFTKNGRSSAVVSNYWHYKKTGMLKEE